MSQPSIGSQALPDFAPVRFHRAVMPTSVLVVDAQLLFADALAAALSYYDDVAVLADRPATGPDAVQAACDRRPDVALVDYWLPHGDGPTVAREMLTRLPHTKVLHLSWVHAPEAIKASLQSGAVGFLSKSLRVAHIHEAITRALSGEHPVFEQGLSRMVGIIERRAKHAEEVATRLATLTPRQQEVLRQLARGSTVEEIAAHLDIGLATVRTHIHRILSKTGASSQLEAVAMARYFQAPPRPS